MIDLGRDHCNHLRNQSPNQRPVWANPWADCLQHIGLRAGKPWPNMFREISENVGRDDSYVSLIFARE